MPQYDLTGLSTDSFENMVQAIALQVFGPSPIIFGSGADGGREATFNGQSNYETGSGKWNGYVVFQAKFRQNPVRDTKADGDWAIKELKKEIKLFIDSAKNRRMPEYYIFITNVALTSVTGTGSKDKLYKVFEEYQDSFPLKDFDVWDYDKITGFLDCYPGIRQTYVGSILPGDVLSELLEQAKVKHPDFEATIIDFIKKRFNNERYANLEQAGYSGEDKIKLASVFVDLPMVKDIASAARQKTSELKTVAQLIEVAQDSFTLNNKSFRAGISRVGDPIVDLKAGKYVIIGGPGLGKSTLSQFLCQLFRAAILSDIEEFKTFDDDKELKSFTQQCQAEKLHFPTVKRFPFKIVLNDFAKVLAKNDNISSVPEYIAYQIGKKTHQQISVECVIQWLTKYPWLIVWDGLDEVPPSSNRRQVIMAIEEFESDLNRIDADIMIVATSRPQGYNEDFNPEFYNHLYLAPLSTEQALHYARRIIAQRYGEDTERNEIVTERIEKALGDDFTSRLMTTPLQVTIMTVLLNKMGRAPRDRWSLFNEYYNTIYRREIERDIPASRILQEFKTDIDFIHTQVGLLLQARCEIPGKNDNLSVDEFTLLVRSRLVAEGHKNDALNKLVEQIIEAAVNRLVFLVGLEREIVGFEIASLREFMASEGIMNGSDDDIRKRLEEILPIISWRNVALFAIGKCFANSDREYLRDFICTQCLTLNNGRNEPLYSYCKIGSQLALEIVQEGSVAHKPKFLEIFINQALQLLDLPSSRLQLDLAEIYTKEYADNYRRVISEKLKANPQHLSVWVCLFELIAKQVKWAIELADKYFPSNASDEYGIINNYLGLGYENSTTCYHWLASKLQTIIPQLNPLEIYPVTFSIEDFFYVNAPEEMCCFICDTLIDSHDNFAGKNQIDIRAENQQERFDSWGVEIIYVSNSLDPETESRLKYFASCSPEMLNSKKAHQYWYIYQYLARFILNPNLLTFSQVLYTIAENYSPELIDFMSKVSPWLITECLAFTQNKDELHQLSIHAREGRLGDVEDWKKAEARWEVNAIVEVDFFYVPTSGLPFDSKIALQGFPCLSSDYYYSRDHTSLEEKDKYFEQLSVLIKLYKQILNSLPQNLVANVIVTFISQWENNKDLKFRKWISNNYNSIKHSLKFLIDKHYENLNSDSEQSIKYLLNTAIKLYDIKLDSELVISLNQFGQKFGLRESLDLDVIPSKDLTDYILVDPLLDNQELDGIINLLVCTEARQISFDKNSIAKLSQLKVENYDDPITKLALNLIQLKLDNISQAEIDRIFDCIEIYPNLQPIIFGTFLSVINLLSVYQMYIQETERNPSIAKITDYLKLLNSNLSEFNARIQMVINYESNMFIARCRSQIRSDRDWQRLGLPQSTVELVNQILG